LKPVKTALVVKVNIASTALSATRKTVFCLKAGGLKKGMPIDAGSCIF